MKKLHVVALLLMTGCSSIESVPVKTYSGKRLDGFPYHLTATNLTIKTTRQLTSCKDGALQFKYAFEVKPSEVIDENHSYVIDPKKLQSWIKTTTLKMEYHPNGNLKSINSEAEDMTGELITAIAGTAAKVVATLGLAGAPPEAEAASICTPEVVKELAELTKSEATLNAATAELLIATTEVDALNLKKKAAGKLWTHEQSDQLLEAIDKLLEKKLAHQKTVITTEENIKKFTITHTANLSYKTTSDWFSKPIDEVTVDEIIEKKWLTNPDPEKVQREVCGLKSNKKCLAGSGVMLGDLNNKPEDIVKHIDGTKSGNTTAGFIYRVPQVFSMGFVKAKRDPEGKYTSDGKINSTVLSISQLGNLHVVPFKSYPFSKLKFSAEFTDSGVLTKIGSESTSGVGKATAALDSVVSKAGDIKKTKSEQSLNELKAKTALLKAQKELVDANKLLEPKTDYENHLTELKASTALYDAELANLKAEKALRDAIAKDDTE